MTEPLAARLPSSDMSLARGLLKAARPKQWAKNVLVFVAPGAAGVLTRGLPGEAWQLWRALFAFVVFCGASAGTYLLNDVVDVEADRRHPTKCRRPIAAGVVPVPVAVACSFLLIGASVAAGLVVDRRFALVVAVYVVLTTTYSMWMKHQPVLDLVGLSGGFVLRLLGGAYATKVGVTSWFLIIACFGSLFVATCKRSAEKRELGEESATVRPTLAVYTEPYLNFLKGVSAGVVLIAYCLFAVERARGFPEAEVPILLSILPFAVAFLRYALLVDQGKGSAPEDLILGDRQLLVIGLIWVALVGVSVYAR